MTLTLSNDCIKMKEIKLIILLLLLSVLGAGATTSILKGYVYAADETPIIGAQIHWLNSKKSVVTNEDGYFEIKGTPHQDHMLVVTYIGYSENRITKNQAGRKYKSGRSSCYKIGSRSDIFPNRIAQNRKSYGKGTYPCRLL